jgi:hypothetical protein
MTESFFERPILNSPYKVPALHHALDKDGQPLDLPPVQGRRRSELITPVPKPRKKKSKPDVLLLELPKHHVDARIFQRRYVELMSRIWTWHPSGVCREILDRNALMAEFP